MIISRNRHSMRQNLILSFLYPGIILMITLVISTIFAILYVATSLIVFFILFLVFLSLLSGLYVYISVRIYRDTYNVYFTDIYQTTSQNYKKLLDNNPNLDNYKSDIEELVSLNEDLDTLSSSISATYIINKVPQYSNLNLEYVSKEKSLVTFKSFQKELKNIIYLSQSYRNVLIDISYDIKDNGLSDEAKEDLLNLLNDVFSDYLGALYMYREDGKSILIYLPVVDSFTKINEQMEEIIKDTSITVRGYDGLKYVGAKFAMVAYPYSDVDELLSDLRYAKRQGKIINVYLPRRIKNSIGGTRILSDSMNHNYMSRILDELNSLNYDYTHDNNDKNILNELFNDLSIYLDIDAAGILRRDEISDTYYHFLTANKNSSFATKEIDNQFLKSLGNICDIDSSYYFSKRSMASYHISRQIDLYDVSSGFYYVIKNDNNKVDYLIYFFNLGGKDFVLDTYLRESLLVMCLKIKHYFELMKDKEEISVYRNESEYIMSLTNYSLYKVDDNTMRLTYFSKDLKTMFPKLEIGEHCYKAIFGNDKMCHDCPLRTSKKKQFIHNKDNFETSLTLNDFESHNKSMLVERLTDKAATGDLYNQDLLINSYNSMVQDISNSYLIKGRGYLVLLNFDSIDSILENNGSEGTLFKIRSFIRKLKNRLHTDEFFYYTNHAIALVLYNVGHVDVINTCEAIYDVTQEMKDVDIKITYLALRWPSAFATAEDFLRNVDSYYNSNKNERGKNFIYFYDHKISRSACKREFIISVIEQEFSDKSFSSVSLQPIVRAKDKRIFGAEILLRINNVYSNAIFNAEEISRIAEQEGKTGIITEAIINFIGNMYKENGDSAFRINNFERIAINIDSTYLKDPNLVNGIINLNNIYNFPNNFLSFEVPEDIIPSHINEIQKMASQLASAHIMFSVDRYTGEYIGVEKLKSLGFKEIKIARNLVFKVDTDSQKYNEVRDIVNNAKETGLDVSVVGVENSAQYQILREFDENMGMQGYHFYKPLSRSDFIAALISYDRGYDD